MEHQLERLKAALADCYQIERELGRGGMATVYLAVDLRHGRNVALKVLRPDLAAALGPERFLQEIRIAAQLTHPHILSVHDSGVADGALYYVMPFIDGESLRARMERDGELPIEDAVRMLRDVVDALACAHRQHVVHRDVKPDNILLAGRHAVVMDFGVAKAVTDAAEDRQLTATGIALGTPQYMAPEQATGDPRVDHRADIYAVGVLAFELLTGRPPFPGQSAREIIAGHLSRPAPLLSEYRSNAPEPLARLVAKCLEKHPADRWQTAEELLAQLEGLPGAGVSTHRGQFEPKGSAPGASARARRLTLAVGGGVLLVAGVLGVGVLRRGPELDPNRIVVVPFENRTGDSSLSAIADLAADWITRGISRSEVLVVAPASVGREAWRGSGTDAVARWREVAARAGAGSVIVGAITREGGRIRFQSEVLNARTAELVTPIDPVAGPVDSASEVVGRLADRIVAALAQRLDPGLRIVAQISHPPSLAAFQQYQRGLELHHLLEWEKALEQLRGAASLDSTFAAPVALSAAAYINLGRFAAAESTLARLTPMRDRLTPGERLWMEWIGATVRGDREGAFRAAEALFRASPPESPWAYVSGLEGMATNRLRLAIERFGAVQVDHELWRIYPHTWNSWAGALHGLGEHGAEIEMVREARRRFPQLISTLQSELVALAATGRVADVERLLEESAALPPEPGRSIDLLATIAEAELRWHGHAEAARSVIDQALERMSRRSSGEVDPEELLEVLYRGGRLREALATFDTVQSSLPPITRSGFAGVVHARLGDRARALAADGELAQWSAPYAFGVPTFWRARIAALLGEPDRAVRLLRQAFLEGAGHGAYLHREPDFESLRRYAPFEELMRPRH